MEDLSVVSLLIAIVAVALGVRAGRNLYCPLNVVLFFEALTFGGAFLIALETPARSRMVFLVSMGMLCTALGAMAANRLHRFDFRKDLTSFRERETSCVFGSKAFVSLAYYSFLVGGVIYVAWHLYTGGVPLLSENVAESKIVSLREGGYLYSRFMRIYLPLLLLIYFVGRGTVLTRRTMLVLPAGLFIVLTLTVSGFRGYVVSFLAIPLAMMVGYHKIPRRTLVWISLAGFVSVLLVTYMSLARGSDLQDTLETISSRTFDGPVRTGMEFVLYQCLPAWGFLHGQTAVMDFSAYLSRLGLGPSDLENFAQYVASLQVRGNPYGVQVAITLMGEAYANFAFPGLVTTMFLYGYLIQWLYVRILRSSKDILWFPLMVYVQFALILAYQGAFVFTVLAELTTLSVFTIMFYGLYWFWSLPFGGPHFACRPLSKLGRRPETGAGSMPRRTLPGGR